MDARPFSYFKKKEVIKLAISHNEAIRQIATNTRIPEVLIEQYILSKQPITISHDDYNQLELNKTETQTKNSCCVTIEDIKNAEEIFFEIDSRNDGPNKSKEWYEALDEWERRCRERLANVTTPSEAAEIVELAPRGCDTIAEAYNKQLDLTTSIDDCEIIFCRCNHVSSCIGRTMIMTWNQLKINALTKWLKLTTTFIQTMKVYDRIPIESQLKGDAILKMYIILTSN